MTTREQLAPILAEFRSIFGAKATEVKWLADKIAALSPPEPTEGLRKAMLAFEDFLNEPPAYEEMLRVREYRHEAYREWLKLRGQITAALSLQDCANLADDNERLSGALKSQIEQTWKESDRADKADHMRVAIETGKVHPALAIDVSEHRQQAYQTGWDDGYAEGFGKAKSDAKS